jgi:transposase-like protein
MKWTPLMSDPSNSLRLEVVGVFRNGRRRYDPASKQRLVEACLQPGVSLSSLALQHGVNANLLRKWVAERQRQQRNGVAEGAIERATDVFVPVVELWLVRLNRQLRLRSNPQPIGQRLRGSRIRLRQG